MSIQVDARLHLSQPEIILRNSQTGEILMRWYRATVQRWLTNGDICYRDLLDPNYNWQDLIRSPLNNADMSLRDLKRAAARRASQ